jgi:chemotaxis protein MotB
MPLLGMRLALPLVLLVTPAIVGGFAVRAADVPTPGERDARVRYVAYVRDEVTVIHVRRGVVTRLMLEPSERIRMAATGFGEYRPVAEGDSEDARAQNRRIELKLTER